MDGRNDRLLQLIECIESMKSDVKKKMIMHARATHAPKSPETSRREFADDKKHSINDPAMRFRAAASEKVSPALRVGHRDLTRVLQALESPFAPMRDL
jgi:hypothetical protein